MNVSQAKEWGRHYISKFTKDSPLTYLRKGSKGWFFSWLLCPLHYLLSVPIFNKKSHWGLKLWFLSFPLNYADPLVWVDYCILLPRSGSYFICSKTHQKFVILGLGTPAGQDRGHPMNSMMPYIPTGKSNSTIEIKWTLLKDHACEKSLLCYIANLSMYLTYSIQLFGKKAAYRLAKKMIKHVI